MTPGQEAELLHTLSLSWRNKCISRAPQIGGNIADRLSQEVERFPSLYKNDDEAFFSVVKTICKSYTLDRMQLNQLLRDLRLDFLKLVATKTYDLPKMRNTSPLNSLDDLADSLAAAKADLDSVLAGKKTVEQVVVPSAVNNQNVIPVVAKPVSELGINLDSLALNKSFSETLKTFNSGLTELYIHIQAQEKTQRLRLQAAAIVLEQARLSRYWQ